MVACKKRVSGVLIAMDDFSVWWWESVVTWTFWDTFWPSPVHRLWLNPHNVGCSTHSTVLVTMETNNVCSPHRYYSKLRNDCRPQLKLDIITPWLTLIMRLRGYFGVNIFGTYLVPQVMCLCIYTRVWNNLVFRETRWAFGHVLDCDYVHMFRVRWIYRC